MRCADIYWNEATELCCHCFARCRLLGCRGVQASEAQSRTTSTGSSSAGKSGFADVNPANGMVIAEVAEADQRAGRLRRCRVRARRFAASGAD